MSEKYITWTKDYCKEWYDKNPRLTVLIGSSIAAYGIAKVIDWYRKRISHNTILEMDLTNTIITLSPIEPIEQMIDSLQQRSRVHLADLIQLITKAASDPKISGLVVKFGGQGMDITMCEEFRSTIASFSVNKQSYCYAEVYDLNMYFVASAFSKIFLHRIGLVAVTGGSAVGQFLKGTLTKLNIEMDVYKRKGYKTAGNTFTEDKFTKEHHEQSKMLLDGLSDILISDIAKSRNLKIEQVKEWLEEGLYTSSKALEAKLVDALVDPALILEEIESITKTKPSFLFSGVYSQRTAPLWPAGKTQVGMVYIAGEIRSGESKDGICGADTVSRAIRAAGKNKDLVALLIRVDSPGGSAIASDSINSAILEAKKAGKKVIVSMGRYAASGGYMVSMNADHIIADKCTITGSIGVISLKPNMRKFYSEWLGITFDSIEATKSSTLFSGIHSNKKGDHNDIKWNEMTDNFYAGFTGDVAKARGLSLERIEELAQGKVYLGPEALKIGLVDSIGGFREAIDITKKLCSVQDDIKLVQYPAPVTLLKMLTQKKSKNSRELDSASSYSLMSYLFQPFYMFSKISSLIAPIAKEVNRVQYYSENHVSTLYDDVSVKME